MVQTTCRRILNKVVRTFRYHRHGFVIPTCIEILLTLCSGPFASPGNANQISKADKVFNVDVKDTIEFALSYVTDSSLFDASCLG